MATMLGKQMVAAAFVAVFVASICAGICCRHVWQPCVAGTHARHTPAASICDVCLLLMRRVFVATMWAAVHLYSIRVERGVCIHCA